MAAETTTEEPQQEYGYIIEGVVYPEPENLTMQDHRIVKRYTSWNFRDLAAMPDEALYVDPDGIAAVMHISYRHKHPDMSFDEIAAIIDSVDLDEAQKGLPKKKADGDRPLEEESTRNPDESSLTRKPSTNEPSGTDSLKSSESSVGSLATTGTSELVTSSPESDQETTEVSAS